MTRRKRERLRRRRNRLRRAVPSRRFVEAALRGGPFSRARIGYPGSGA